MQTVLLKALSFVFIIALGYTLKRVGLFQKSDYSIMVKVVLNITLPAAVISSFATTTLDRSMLILSVIGFLANCLMLGLGLLLGRGKPKGDRALFALASPGFNIGAFAMPFAQNFLGAAGAASACLFDTGNAIMCTGGSYAITDSLLNPAGQKGNPLLALGRKLLSSVPFVTYVTMLVLALADISIPVGVANFIQPIANANPFCSMFMIGLMFELNLEPSTMKNVLHIVVLRNLAAMVLAFACYRLLPLPLITRQTLAVIMFAPPSALTPAFTEKCGGSAAAASCLSSMCIITALICMIGTMMLLHIA